MTILALDALNRARLDWPEPLILELIAEIYQDVSTHEDIWPAARLHSRFLRQLTEGETAPAGTARLELIASCAARAVDPEAIERAEQAVFRELTRLSEARFRNSPRHLRVVLAKLASARDILTKRAEAPRGASTKPSTSLRKPVALRPSLAAVG